MIRRLVMFTNGIETLWYFSVKMGATFEKLGYEVFYFDQCKEYDSLSKLMAFAVPGITAAVSFNFEGCSGESYLTMQRALTFLKQGTYLLSTLWWIIRFITTNLFLICQRIISRFPLTESMKDI